MRINKFLSECGVCSRREADALIEKKLVTINGEIAECGMQANEDDIVCLRGKRITPLNQKTYLAFNKPRGIVCTSEKREKNNLIKFLDYPVRVTYAGRLDKDSQGLMILTDDGKLIDELMTGRNGHEKEYIVNVSQSLTEEKLQKMAAGVYLKDLDMTTRACKIWQSGEKEFHIVLTQGINRQIRRMCKCVGLNVVKLTRIRMENICLGDLENGKYRNITQAELNELKSRLSKAGV